jgi:hypothetical protein
LELLELLVVLGRTRWSAGTSDDWRGGSRRRREKSEKGEDVWVLEERLDGR